MVVAAFAARLATDNNSFVHIPPQRFDEVRKVTWQNQTGLSPRKYSCGFCNGIVASAMGYNDHSNSLSIYLCPNCNSPTFINSFNVQYPETAPGGDVAHLPIDVAALYKEARLCIAANCCTAAVLICRKLLMNIAVTHGAKEGLSFVAYIEHLASSGFIPPNGKTWVDHIRKKGNEATHEIALMSRDDAQDLVVFSEMLLKFVFEFPNRVPTAQ